ncbi:MAG TPA: LEA type 2 family protein [Nitrososphaeraceae archaeon]|nr:LEA type 2 family protein [Nitrososphaeraceae archaeon]
MNTKAIYALGAGIAILGIAIFLIMSTGLFGGNTTPNKQQINQNSLRESVPLSLSIKNITVNKINNNAADIQVLFNAYNPTRGTVILESIEYNLLVNDKRIVSGDIGEKLEGFVTSSQGIYPIISNGTVTLKDKQVSERNNAIAPIWDKMISGKITYTVRGTFSYKQTSSLQSVSADKDFDLTFP